MTLVLLFFFAMGAAFVQRTTGFGFGIFIMTMLPYLMPSYGEATALSGLLAMVTSLFLVFRYYKSLNWGRLLPILITFLMVSFVAVRVVAQLDKKALQIILGMALIIASVYFWFFSDKVRIKPILPVQVSLGTLSGFMGGFFGMQGPPAVLYFIEVSQTKEQYVALAQTYFLLGNFMMTLYRAHSGFVTPAVWHSWCWALPAVILGTYIGGLAFRFISLQLLRRIVFIYIGVSGIIALLGALL